MCCCCFPFIWIIVADLWIACSWDGRAFVMVCFNEPIFYRVHIAYTTSFNIIIHYSQGSIYCMSVTDWAFAMTRHGCRFAKIRHYDTLWSLRLFRFPLRSTAVAYFHHAWYVYVRTKRMPINLSLFININKCWHICQPLISCWYASWTWNVRWTLSTKKHTCCSWLDSFRERCIMRSCGTMQTHKRLSLMTYNQTSSIQHHAYEHTQMGSFALNQRKKQHIHGNNDGKITYYISW